MMNHPLHNIWFLGALFFGLVRGEATFAADIEVEFDLQPAAIRQNESATANFTINGVINPPQPSLKGLQDFDVQDAGSRRTIINGYPSTTYSYRLKPRKVGDFTIGPFLYRYGTQEITLPEKKLKVVAPGEKTGLEISQSDLIFATLQISNTNVYTQQYFDFDVALYWRQLNLSSDINIIDIETPGLQFGQFQGTRTSEEFVNGNRYYVSRFRNKAKALAQGTYTIHPTVRVDILVSGRMQLMREVKTIDIVVEPVTVVIKAPPATDRPASFRGAVGKFQFNAEVSPLEMDEGTPITIRMALSGSGNLDSALPPEIVDEKTFKIYDSRLTEDRLNQSHNAGRRLFEQVVEPRSPSVTEIPALEFSYFDPEEERYQTITRGPFPIIITPATNQVVREVGPQSSVFGTAQKQVFGEYIEYLKPLPRRWTHQSQAQSSTPSPLFLGLQAVPPLLALLGYLFGRRREVLAEDIEKARKHQAPRVARAAIRQAQQALKASDVPGFYEAASNALEGYLANKLNIGPGEVSIAAVRARFDASKHAELIEQLDQFFHLLEAKRFTPAGAAATSPSELSSQLDTLNQLLKACEKVKV